MSTTLKFSLLVVGAALLALIARMLFANMSQSQISAPEPTHIVMVAATSLPAGLLLRAEDLDWKTLPKSDVPEGAILQDSADADTLAGIVLRRDVRAGAYVKSSDVIRHDSPGFLAAALKPGMRAVSVAVDNVSGNAGLIRPGDYVDIILIQQTRASDHIDMGRARSVVSETVVENVRIIAVGSVFQETDENVRSTSRPAPVRTVTIEVQPRTAGAVAVAGRLGTLTLALRSFVVTDPSAHQDEQTGAIVAWDRNENKPAPVWAGDVSRAIIDLAPDTSTDSPTAVMAPPSMPRVITIMRGSERNTQTLGDAQQ